MLLRVPKGAGGAKINSSAVTAAITGTTVMVETHALTKKNKNSYYKFIVLEGTARLYLPGRLGESTLVKAGQMIIMRADSKMIPEPVDVDIGKITQSSLLVTGFSTPLGSEALIAFEKTKQNEQKSSGQLYETNLMIYGGGTNVFLADPNTVDVAVSAESNAAQSPTPTPTATLTPVPTPDKFGTPSVIASSNPCVITSGTTITTDPSITTKGVTDYGKIYRGSTDDGAFSQWAFGPTSAFDTALNIDTEFFADPAHVPIAVFKFQSLSLNGNPTIDTSNGGVTNLGLIGADGITSGPPGGFFQSFISTNAGGSIAGNAQNVVAVSGDLSANGGILIATYDTGFLSVNPTTFIAGGTIGGNASVLLTAQDILTTSTASGTPGLDIMALEASIYTNGSGSLGGNADAVVQAQQNISAPGSSFFTVANGNFQGFGGGTIGGDALIDVGAVNFSTGPLSDDIYNYLGGRIGNNASINLALSGDLWVQGDALFRIFNYGNSDGLEGGQIGENATISVTAASIQAASLLAEINNSQGGQIGGSASINVSASDPVVVTNDATFRIDGSDGATSAAINFNGGNYNVGGTFLGFIDGNGTFTLNNATITADTVKVGVFGSNGTLRIGGGNISANTLLHLYAPSSSGSGGIIDFVSNVTLNSSATAAVIAANTVTIENGVVVTIGASTSANVYTNVPNYSARSGGNNKTSDTFVGAVTTQPLGGQPPFDSPSTRVATRSTRTSAPVIHVTDSSQLSSLLDNATPGPNGKVRVSPVTRSRNAPVQGSTRTMAAELHRSVAAKARSGVLASRLQ